MLSHSGRSEFSAIPVSEVYAMVSPGEISKSDSVPLEEQIKRRAHEIYLENGGTTGSDLDDLLQAEAEIAAAQEQEF